MAKNRSKRHAAARAAVPIAPSELATAPSALATAPSELPTAPSALPTASPAVVTEADTEPTSVRWLAMAPAVLAGVFLLTFLLVSVRRIAYPFALEWMEGGMLDEVRWLLAGHALYVRPSVDYVPMLYNPLYFWVSAAACKALGTSFLALRLVSLGSTLGAFALLYALVVAETRSKMAGLLGAGLYAATFKATQQFFDVARVDALFVLLAVAPLWVLRTRPTRAGRAVAAALLVLCFLTKQSGVFVAAPLVAFVLWERRWRGVPFAAAVAGGIAACVGVLDATSGGWYRFYAFVGPSAHRTVPYLWTEFWTVDLMGPLGCACVGALFVLLGPGAMARRERLLWAAGLAGVLVASWSTRVHDGGWSNVLMPAYALLAALFAIALHGASTLAGRAAPDARRRWQVLLPLVATVQLAMLLYDPKPMVPTARDEAAGWRLVETLKAAPGDTFTPSDSYLATMAGKRPHLHEMAVYDVMNGPPGEAKDALVADIRAAYARRRWAMVVTDDDLFADDVLATYQRGPDAIADPGAFYPVTGARFRPGSTFTPK